MCRSYAPPLRRIRTRKSASGGTRRSLSPSCSSFLAAKRAEKMREGSSNRAPRPRLPPDTRTQVYLPRAGQSYMTVGLQRKESHAEARSRGEFWRAAPAFSPARLRNIHWNGLWGASSLYECASRGQFDGCLSGSASSRESFFDSINGHMRLPCPPGRRDSRPLRDVSHGNSCVCSAIGISLLDGRGSRMMAEMRYARTGHRWIKSCTTKNDKEA